MCILSLVGGIIGNIYYLVSIYFEKTTCLKCFLLIKKTACYFLKKKHTEHELFLVVAFVF